MSFKAATKNNFSGTGYITSVRDQEERLNGYRLVEPEKIPIYVKPSMHIKFINKRDGALRNGGIVVGVRSNMIIVKGINDRTFPVKYPENDIYVKVDPRTISMQKSEFLDFIIELSQSDLLTFKYKNQTVTIDKLKKAFMKRQQELADEL